MRSAPWKLARFALVAALAAAGMGATAAVEKADFAAAMALGLAEAVGAAIKRRPEL